MHRLTAHNPIHCLTKGRAVQRFILTESNEEAFAGENADLSPDSPNNGDLCPLFCGHSRPRSRFHLLRPSCRTRPDRTQARLLLVAWWCVRL